MAAEEQIIDSEESTVQAEPVKEQVSSDDAKSVSVDLPSESEPSPVTTLATTEASESKESSVEDFPETVDSQTIFEVTADTSIVTPSSSTADSNPDVSETNDESVTVVSSSTSTDSSSQSATSSASSETVDNTVATSTSSTSTSTGGNATATTTTNAGGGNDEVEGELDTDIQAETDPLDVVSEESDEDAVTDGASEESLITSDDINSQLIQTEILVNDENYYQFSRQSCVAVGDGTYHCTSTDTEQYDTQSVVYSKAGERGNLEIFLETANGEVRQITDNEFDDTSPYYDAETLQVVWQRLIAGRYQIILYDIVEDKESQLTFSRTNNMEPKVSSEGVVWQAWDNNDWEIMYFDGEFTDQITENSAQDVAPVVRDGYVLWTVIGKGEQEAKVYSLKSKEILTISGYDGGVIENPRFVLVYDTKFDNGDIITQGFDPATGVSQPISAQPRPEPVNIPKSDPLGEIRALIQNKSLQEDELDRQLVHNGGGAGSTTDSATEDTLDLNDAGDSVDQKESDETGEFELTEFDLILTGIDTTSNELNEIDQLLNDDSLDLQEGNSTQ